MDLSDWIDMPEVVCGEVVIVDDLVEELVFVPKLLKPLNMLQDRVGNAIDKPLGQLGLIVDVDFFGRSLLDRDQEILLLKRIVDNQLLAVDWVFKKIDPIQISSDGAHTLYVLLFGNFGIILTVLSLLIAALSSLALLLLDSIDCLMDWLRLCDLEVFSLIIGILDLLRHFFLNMVVFPHNWLFLCKLFFGHFVLFMDGSLLRFNLYTLLYKILFFFLLLEIKIFDDFL